MYDPVRDAEQHISDEERWLETLPTCDYCGEPIQDDYYYEIGEECICEECLDRHYRKWT